MAQTIAIDYDGTFSADQLLWRQFIRSATALGAHVLICTGRAFPPDDTPPGVEVHCTGGQAKADYLASIGITVNVWIDDDPGSIIQNDTTFQGA